MNGKPFALLLMAFGGAMIIVALMQREEMRTKRLGPRISSESAELSSSQTAVERYRQELGDKLNRDRIAVQHGNIADMRMRQTQSQTAAIDPVLNGVPLIGERTYAVRDRTIEYKDLGSEIRARLDFQRNLDQWEAQARREYIAEFIANAEAMGYKVEIDANYNVTYESKNVRAPQSFALVIPSFLRAPYCSVRN